MSWRGSRSKVERLDQGWTDVSRMTQGIAKKTCDGLFMTPPIISALHSAVVDVRSFDVGVRDYGRLLGQPPVRIELNRVRGTRSAFFALANMVLELRSTDLARPSADPAVNGELVGTFGLSGIRLASPADDVAQVLASRGVALASGETEEGDSVGLLGVRTWRSDRIEPAASRGLPIEVVSRESAPATGADDPTDLSAEGRSVMGPDWKPASASAQVRSLDHVVVLSPDPESTRAFYQDGLGLRLALDKSFAERGVRLLFFRVGGTTIEIGGRLDVEPRPDRSDRFGGLAWQVVDLDEIKARLEGDGFDVSEIRTGNKPGTRVCTVRNPVHDVATLLIEPVA